MQIQDFNISELPRMNDAWLQKRRRQAQFMVRSGQQAIPRGGFKSKATMADARKIIRLWQTYLRAINEEIQFRKRNKIRIDKNPRWPV